MTRAPLPCFLPRPSITPLLLAHDPPFHAFVVFPFLSHPHSHNPDAMCCCCCRRRCPCLRLSWVCAPTCQHTWRGRGVAWLGGAAAARRDWTSNIRFVRVCASYVRPWINHCVVHCVVICFKNIMFMPLLLQLRCNPLTHPPHHHRRQHVSLHMCTSADADGRLRKYTCATTRGGGGDGGVRGWVAYLQHLYGQQCRTAHCVHPLAPPIHSLLLFVRVFVRHTYHTCHSGVCAC